MNHYQQQQQQQQQQGVPSISPNLLNLLQNNSQGQQQLRQQPQQYTQPQFNRSSLQRQFQQPLVSPPVLSLPRQPQAPLRHPKVTFSYTRPPSNLSRMLNNAIQGFPDPNNNRVHQNTATMETPPVNSNMNNRKDFVPNRYISHSNGSMFANDQLVQSYNPLMHQNYSRPSAPPAYSGEAISTLQQGLNNNTSQSRQLVSSIGSMNEIPQQSQQQQPQSVYSQTLMQRLSGYSPVEKPINEQQRPSPASFLMQQLQSENNTIKTTKYMIGENLSRPYQTSQSNNIIQSSEKTQLNRMNQSITPQVQTHVLKEFSINSSTDITDNLINSPMSVGSVKSDTSNGSSNDVKKVGPLNSSNSNEGFRSLFFAEDKDLSPSFTRMLQNINVDCFSDDNIKAGGDNDDARNSFIDAVLTGIMSEFSEQDKDCKTLEQVNINWLDSNFFDISENDELDQYQNTRLEESLFQRSLSSPANNVKKRSPQNKKTNARNLRLKSDSTLIPDSRSLTHPYMRSLTTVKNKKPDTTGMVKRRHSDSAITSNPKASKMYFENKDFYKFRAKFRDLIRRQVQAGVLSQDQLPMKSSRLFLNLLTKSHEWVGESVTSAVKSDKEINMKNFTKRKITIHNDIPPEHIHKFSEVSTNQPFTYSNYESNGKTKPSDKLMDYLQQ